MTKSAITFVVSMLAIGLAPIACSAPDPGVLTYGSPRSSVSGAPGPVDAGSWAAAPPATGAHHDAGAGQTDAASARDAAPEDGGAVATFLGDPSPYASKPPAASARDRHAAAGQAAQQPSSDCLVCHGANGPGVQFIAAGFIATAPNGTSGASDVEVRVWSTTSKTGASGHTDADGFFWIKPPTDAIATPFQAGVRTATAQKVMPAQAPGGACNGASCHGGGQGAIHIP